MAVNGELRVQTAVLRRTPSLDPVVVADVGANVGAWTCALLSRATLMHEGPLAIHAFEPDEVACTRFLESLPSLPDGVTVELNRLGLSNQPGERGFHIVGDAEGTNSLHLPFEAPVPWPTKRVTLTTLDSYAAEKGIEHFGLVKIDTEGHDLRVMEGAHHLLQANSIDVVQFEYNHRWIGARAYLRDAFELLAPFRYRLGKVTPRGIGSLRRLGS